MKDQRGLTLLEVLVALFIVALAMTAVLKTTQENVLGTHHLAQKNEASWVALYALNQARLGLIYFPEEPDEAKGEQVQLGKAWHWRGFSRKTANPHLMELHVQVFSQNENNLSAELQGYEYAV